jgi:hypothetical protein
VVPPAGRISSIRCGSSPAQQQSDAGQTVVVARREVRAQHAAVRGRRRLGERDLGPLVGDRLDRPSVQGLPGGGDRQLAGTLDRQGRLDAVLADRGEGLAILVESQDEAVGRAPEMMQLREHLAARRHGDAGRDRHGFIAGRERQ